MTLDSNRSSLPMRERFREALAYAVFVLYLLAIALVVLEGASTVVPQ